MPARNQAKIVSQIYVICGLKEPSQTDADLFVTCINERYRWITDKELVQAFKMNAFGDLKEQTEFFGIITVANLCKVINHFEIKRNPVKLEMDLAAQILEKSDEEKAALVKQWEKKISEYFTNFKATGILPQDAICAAIWDSLNKRKRIEISDDQKQEYYDEAVTEIVQRMRNGGEMEDVKTVRRIADTGIIPSDIQTQSKNRAKRNHLTDLWTSLETISI